MTSQSESKKPDPRSNRRRRLIVDKPFQYRLIGLLLAIWSANSIFFAILLYYFYQGHILFFYRLEPQPGKIPLISMPSLFAVTIGFVFLFGLVIIAIIGMYLSNQIAGPLYRVKVSLNRVSEGDINFEIRFREGDFLRDFPGYFNHMLRSLKEQAVEDIEALNRIENSLSDLGTARETLRELRQKKGRQLGVTSDGAEAQRRSEPVTHAVH